MPDTPVPASAPAGTFGMSESAANRIAWLMGQDEHKGLMLRISVSGGVSSRATA